jgi:hypothetical protein
VERDGSIAPDAPDRHADTLTVLRCDFGRRATKLIRPGPEVLGYDAGTWFRAARVPVGGLADLAHKLDRIAAHPRCFVIRGEPLPGTNLGRCRRLLHEQEDGTQPTFREVPRRWALFDHDTAEEPGLWDWRDGALSALSLRAKLPAEFQGVSFWWSFTSSAGFKAGLRMRLAFWLDRPATGDELGRWLAMAPVDHATLRPVQPTYLARPILEHVDDPVLERSGVEWDFRDEVKVPELPEEPERPAAVVAAERRRAERTMPARRHGWPFAVLEDVARTIAGTPAASVNRWGGDGRHHALYCGALRVSGLIGEGKLEAGGTVRVLAEAAAQAGLDDARENARTIRNGFRRGGLSA